MFITKRSKLPKKFKKVKVNLRHLKHFLFIINFTQLIFDLFSFLTSQFLT